jgi:hypothetical protein
MSDSSTITSSAAQTLKERMHRTTVTDLKEKHRDAFVIGEKVAANHLDHDELRELDTLFVNEVEGVPVAELDSEDLFDGISNAVGLERARELISFGSRQLESASELAVFLLGVVETWREADV